jgi:hypothetical protein
MTKMPKSLKPVNRHFLIVPHYEAKADDTQSAVLLPDGYEPPTSRHIIASVVDIAPDCSEHFKNLRHGAFSDNLVVVDRGMIEEISINNKTNYLILENYVVGILRGINES